jgi:hypothetical protein
MQSTPENTVENPFSRFIPFWDYVRSRPEIFQSKSAGHHLRRFRGPELRKAGAMISAGRAELVDPPLMDEMILKFFREEGALKPRDQHLFEGGSG